MQVTSQQGADKLNVSIEFFDRLLDTGEIKFSVENGVRFVQLSDVDEYKKGMDARRRQSLEKLAAQAQELDMGY